MSAELARTAPAPSKDSTVEARRLEAVRKLDIIDTPREEAYDRIARLIQSIFGVAVATISVMDAHRQWYKAAQGMDAESNPREGTFCSTVIQCQKPVVVQNTLEDPQFRDNEYVTGPAQVRFYAGIPLKSREGHCIGTICAIDTKPRRFGAKHVEILKDFASIVMEQMELRERALRDSLTGALSRRAFREEGARAAALASRHRHNLSAVVFDLDHFKSINDRFGHPAGDEVLSRTAKICQQHLRRSDIFGRLGGEEFAVLLPETDRRGAMEVAEKIRASVRNQRFEFAGETIGVTASFGVSAFDIEVKELDALLGRADAALYQAKGEGRNRAIAWGGKQEAPAAARRRVLKAGKILFPNRTSTIDCTVRTLGEDGAGLNLISTQNVPHEFRLMIRADGFEASCRVTSRTETHIEVEFR